ncbi:nitroreductase family protein [Shewanella algae]|uniref:nitroreductase family protein n=1 Tax=Shewanella algae TaxID=38313 RepID=UPI001C58AB00|nr:nitroreductase family protein [Shewanella algae]
MKSLLKKIIPLNSRRKIKTWFSVINLRVLDFCSKSIVFTKIYYTLFNNYYTYEQKATLSGKVAFIKAIAKEKATSPQLRRNIHRLEKGLIMKPRRDVFGEAFILDTIDMFLVAFRSNKTCKEELQWALDVLNEYFSVVSDTKIIKQARDSYMDIVKTGGYTIENKKPYIRNDNMTNTISPEQLQGLFQQRRSIRWYKDETVDESLIEKAITLASSAPSACNRQPFEFLVINNAKNAQRITALAAGTAGFYQQVPCVILVVGDLSCYPSEADKNVIYIDSSLASMQLMLGLETLGLSSCPINWPINNDREKRIREIIKFPDYKKVIMMISVGYADEEGMIPFSAKKTNELLRTNLEQYK